MPKRRTAECRGRGAPGPRREAGRWRAAPGRASTVWRCGRRCRGRRTAGRQSRPQTAASPARGAGGHRFLEDAGASEGAPGSAYPWLLPTGTGWPPQIPFLRSRERRAIMHPIPPATRIIDPTARRANRAAFPPATSRLWITCRRSRLNEWRGHRRPTLNDHSPAIRFTAPCRVEGCHEI